MQKYMEATEAPECDEFETECCVEEEDHVDISHLHDDMLLYIFMFLTMKDRIKIERGI